MTRWQNIVLKFYVTKLPLSLLLYSIIFIKLISIMKKLESWVNIRMDSDDYENLKQVAEKFRVPVSTYCRVQLTKHVQNL